MVRVMSDDPISIAKLIPNERVVAVLRVLLEEAESGRLRGLIHVSKFATRSSHEAVGEVDARDVALACVDMQFEVARRGEP